MGAREGRSLLRRVRWAFSPSRLGCPGVAGGRGHGDSLRRWRARVVSSPATGRQRRPAAAIRTLPLPPVEAPTATRAPRPIRARPVIRNPNFPSGKSFSEFDVAVTPDRHEQYMAA